MKFEDVFWESTIEELKKGYTTHDDNHICLVCGEVYEDGVIYTMNNKMMEAKKAIKEHIKLSHGSMMHFLLDMDKKYTGLTENQKNLIQMFQSGLTDKEIVKKQKVNASTIRSQRFSLREKAKQAKIFLVIIELMEDAMNKTGSSDDEKLAHIHRTATSVDDRYAITNAEKEKVIETYFNHESSNLILNNFPTKQKRKIVVLEKIASQFEKGRRYSEKEVNDILKAIYSDYVTIRRYLIEYGFVARTIDCSEYWLKT